MKKVQNKLNANESQVLRVLTARRHCTIAELKKLFLSIAKKRLIAHYSGWNVADIDTTAQSYVRNALRKLVKLGLAKQTGRGTYKRTRKAVGG